MPQPNINPYTPSPRTPTIPPRILKAMAQEEAEGMAMMMGWSSLPPDLALLIGGRIALHADYIRFRAVCSSWRFAIPGKPRHLPTQLPFLLLPPGTDVASADARTLYSLTEARSYLLRLAGLQHHCLGSSRGWLVLLGPAASLSMLDPFTGVADQLPPATSIPFLFDTVGPSDIQRCRADAAGAGWWKHFVHKAKMCWDRLSAESLVTVVFPKAGLALWQRGHKSWTRVGRFWRFADAEFYEGRLYAVTRGGILSTIDVLDSADMTAKETVLVSSPPFSYNDTAVYLVESPEALLLVVRRFFCEAHLPRRRTIGFQVFRLVEPTTEPRWAVVDDLGDQMLIVERGTSVALSTFGLKGCEANCIYFSEEYDVCRDDQLTVLDVGVFNMTDGSINQLDCCPPGTNARWPLPTWINPCLW